VQTGHGDGNYIVPARHEANVLVKMSDKDIPHPTDNWVIETKQLSSRVMTARTLVDGKQKRLVARVCNYSDTPYELKADYCLAHTEPVEYIPGPGEKPSDELCTSSGINMLSLSTGATMSTDLLPTMERDPVTTLCATTVGVSTAPPTQTAIAPVTGATAVSEPPPSTDNPAADDPYSHIQCLLDGLPGDLTDEQRARVIAFIRSWSNVFSHSEYDTGRTRIILHCIDTGDNDPHFEQLQWHPTTQLPMIDSMSSTCSCTLLSSRQHRRGVRASSWFENRTDRCDSALTTGKSTSLLRRTNSLYQR